LVKLCFVFIFDFVVYLDKSGFHDVENGILEENDVETLDGAEEEKKSNSQAKEAAIILNEIKFKVDEEEERKNEK